MNTKKHWWLSGGFPVVENLLFGSNLSSAPSDFTTTAEFTFSGGKLNSTGTPASSGWGSFAGWSYLSSQERQRIRTFFTIGSTTSVFRVLKYNSNSWAKSGSVAEIDFENNLIKLYETFLYPTTPSGTVQQIALTVTKNTAHEYSVEFSKLDLVTVIKLTNITTGETNTLTQTQSGTGVPEGVFRGQVALQHVKGSFAFSGLYYYVLNTITPNIAIYGDSYVDGYSLSDDLRNRWTYRVFNYERQDALISGWGGNTGQNIITRLYDWSGITPQNVIILAGYNNTVYTDWIDQYESLIRIFVNKGSNVILTTFAPAPAVAAIANINSMNAYVLTRGYPILDIAALLTVGGNRTTIDSGLLLPDNAHPNSDGHELIYDEYLTLTKYSFQTLNNGIFTYYNFHSNSNSSTGFLNGVNSGSPTYVTGKLGNCISLNGSTQYVSIASPQQNFRLLTFTNADNTDVKFSIGAWCNVASLSSVNYIVAKRDASNYEYQFFINTAGKVGILLWSQNNPAVSISVTSDTVLSINTWYHIVATYNGSGLNTGLKIYINGVESTTTKSSAGTYVNMGVTTASFLIGSVLGTAGNYNGKIDELGVWRNRELTLSNVQSLYNSGNGLEYSNFLSN